VRKSPVRVLVHEEQSSEREREKSVVEELAWLHGGRSVDLRRDRFVPSGLFPLLFLQATAQVRNSFPPKSRDRHLCLSGDFGGKLLRTCRSSHMVFSAVQSRFAETRFAETRFAETLTLTLTLNPNFGESGFGESGRHLLRMQKCRLRPTKRLTHIQFSTSDLERG